MHNDNDATAIEKLTGARQELAARCSSSFRASRGARDPLSIEGFFVFQGCVYVTAHVLPAQKVGSKHEVAAG